MKIAIPLFEERISPRFDCAEDFLLVVVENGRVLKREVFPVARMPALERIKNLKDLNVDTLVCGGIDEVSMRRLSRHHVEIYSWVTGLAEDALRSLLNGQLASFAMVGPGGKHRGMWRFRRHDGDGETEQKGRGKRHGRSGGQKGKRGGGWGAGQGRNSGPGG